MEQPQHDHVPVGDLVSDFVGTDQNTADLARLVLGQDGSQTGLGRETPDSRHDSLSHPRSCSRIDGLEELVQTQQILACHGRPAQRHGQRTLRLATRFLPRPAAQASMSS